MGKSVAFAGTTAANNHTTTRSWQLNASNSYWIEAKHRTLLLRIWLGRSITTTGNCWRSSPKLLRRTNDRLWSICRDYSLCSSTLTKLISNCYRRCPIKIMQGYPPANSCQSSNSFSSLRIGNCLGWNVLVSKVFWGITLRRRVYRGNS